MAVIVSPFFSVYLFYIRKFSYIYVRVFEVVPELEQCLLNLLSIFFFFKILLIYFRERECSTGGEAEGEGEGDNLQQTPC